MIAELVPTTATASALVDMLRRHYLPEGRLPGGIFATEIGSPDGSRRADALWCPWSTIGGTGLVGHEVKVSRSDVIVELLDPMKAEPWARFCNEWWLVVAHPALIDGLQIPTAWGVMAPPSGRRRRSMTIVRPAPRLKPRDTGVAWQRIATWNEHQNASRIREAESKAATATMKADYAERELLERQLAEGGRTDHRAAIVGRILAGLDKQRHFRTSYDEVDVDDVVAAIVDVEGHRRLARRTRDEIHWLAEEARQMAAPLARVADDLERLSRAQPKVAG
jgi:hypothetical protein